MAALLKVNSLNITKQRKYKTAALEFFLKGNQRTHHTSKRTSADDSKELQ